MMTREQVKAWKAGWKLVNEVQDREMVARTSSERLGEVAELFELSAMFPDRGPDPQVAIVRARWAKLRRTAL